MKVFKLYGKLLKKNIGAVISYVIAFMVISVLFISSRPGGSGAFQETRIQTAIINLDENTALTTGLTDYLKSHFITVKEVEESKIPDALYYREIFLAITIPENFTRDFLAGNEVSLTEEAVPDSVATVTVQRAVDKYLGTVVAYQHQLPEESLESLTAQVREDLDNEIKVNRTVVIDSSLSSVKTFYNYLSYLFYAMIMSIVGIVMMRISRIDIKRRLIASPVSQTRFNLGILLGHLLFTIAVVIVLVGLSFIYFPASMLSKNGMLFILNAFCVSLPILGFGYLLSLLIRNQNALNAAVNVISLGTSFISGAFIPINLLGSGLLKFAHILPNYYYIYNNERISYLTNYSFSEMKGIYLYMGIQILFAIGFLLLALFVSKKQGKQEA